MERLQMHEEAARNSLDEARAYVAVLEEEIRVWREEACSLSRAFNQPLSDKAMALLKETR
jgi:hypothetical protein